MAQEILARSISRTVRDMLLNGLSGGQALAVFRRACDLAVSPVASADEGMADVVALVLPDIGDGPLNVVVDHDVEGWGGTELGSQVHLEGNRLLVADLEIILDQATLWEPRPDWQRLRARSSALAMNPGRLRDVALENRPEGSLLELLATRETGSGSVAGAPWDRLSSLSSPPTRETGSGSVADPAFFSEAREGMQALKAGWAGDLAQLEMGAARLAGLGWGLTPAGDDCLLGCMLWAWLTHPDPPALCQSLLAVAAPRTTLLSAALLGRAAAGECGQAWHSLFQSLTSAPGTELSASVRDVLAFGNTSGADALAGFLWLALDRLPAGSDHFGDVHMARAKSES